MVIQSDSRESGWIKFVLITGGLVWIGRAVLELVFQPEYWSPQTAVDYTAVISFTLALYLLAISLWLIHRERQLGDHFSKWLWLGGIWLACFGAVVAGSANFIEDWLAIKAFGELFVVGGLTLAVGFLLTGISLFWANDLPRWLGWLFISCIFGLSDGGGFWMGFVLIFLAVWRKRQV
jgi:hypothetical protein